MKYKNKTGPLSIREYERLIFIVEMHQRENPTKATEDLLIKLKYLMNKHLQTRYRNYGKVQ
jgi:hypothetical protein